MSEKKKARTYATEYKVQAVKLADEIGTAKAAAELGVPKDTVYGWMKAAREGRLDLGLGAQTPKSAMSISGELMEARKEIKRLEKENKRLQEENEFLAEASAFFAASRRK